MLIAKIEIVPFGPWKIYELDIKNGLKPTDVKVYYAKTLNSKMFE